mmetsp:Transcript_15178/g.45662  ORF Transcript_15178/g.45662 Transcript_15178/m.45662 type:complete len:368 (+) Transcript_15178:238-1341(+)
MRSNSARSFADSSAMDPKSKVPSPKPPSSPSPSATSSQRSSLSRRGSGTRPRSHMPPLSGPLPSAAAARSVRSLAKPGMESTCRSARASSRALPPPLLVRSRSLSRPSRPSLRRVEWRQRRMISSGSTGSMRTGSAASRRRSASGMCASDEGKLVSRCHSARIALRVCRTTSRCGCTGALDSASNGRNGSLSREEDKLSGTRSPAVRLEVEPVLVCRDSDRRPSEPPLLRTMSGGPLRPPSPLLRPLLRRSPPGPRRRESDHPPALSAALPLSDREMPPLSASAASFLKDSCDGLLNLLPPRLHCGPRRRRVPPGLVMPTELAVSPFGGAAGGPLRLPPPPLPPPSSSSSMPKELRDMSPVSVMALS